MENLFEKPKTCYKCKKVKNLTEYNKALKGRDGYSRECKSCFNEAQINLERRKLKLCSLHVSLKEKPYGDLRPGSKDYNKAAWLKREYNLTLLQYNEMFERQEGCCAICKKHQIELNRMLSVDHNHETGEIRELLCSSCNFGIGNFKEDITILTNSIEYLKKYTLCQ